MDIKSGPSLLVPSAYHHCRSEGETFVLTPKSESGLPKFQAIFRDVEGTPEIEIIDVQYTRKPQTKYVDRITVRLRS